MTEVRCECGALFGVEQGDGSLQIKYRDLVRRVYGSVEGACRKCGRDVRWPMMFYGSPTIGHNTYTPRPFSYTCNCACSRCSVGDCCQIGPLGGWGIVSTTHNITLE